MLRLQQSSAAGKKRLSKKMKVTASRKSSRHILHAAQPKSHFSPDCISSANDECKASDVAKFMTAAIERFMRER